MSDSQAFLNRLNSQQLQAVKHDPSHPLQILAGPGSGKTAVLTARIAHLILHRTHAASSICAVTFTNKAANEMRERLIKLLGKQTTSEIKMGTFHSLCARFLRQHARKVGIAENFTVCDADESKKLIKEFIKPFKTALDSTEFSLTEGVVLDAISKAKAKGKTPAVMLEELEDPRKASKFVQGELPTQLRGIVAEIYMIYEKSLRKSNCLDFDDLLVFGVRLFREHPDTASWCKHILVDEFQDTNTVQYDLMCAIAAQSRCVSTVGDPDQSIYGWRSAEVENLAKMERDFKPVKQIFLERNYRSTASILAFSLAVVSQDTERIKKSLHTSHPLGPRPMLRAFDSEESEAAFIAREIKRTSAYMGGTFKWSDYAILLRFNALSRVLESALQKEGIPNRILGGHKFFERLEVKDLLAYLQLVDNPQYNPAFIRASNVPSRGIGDKTLKEIAKRAQDAEISQLALVERIYDGKVPDTKPSVKKKLAPFIKTIRVLRSLANEGSAPQVLINRLVDLVDYQEHLQRTQPDWDTRWENVQELITFATDVHNSNYESEDKEVKGENAESPEDPPTDNPLRTFLQASTLSVGGDHEQEESKEKVTISTCHSAKGLEWPIVFIPAAENGVFPFSRTESVPEERRLLYVACTRSQALLYITNSTVRKHAGDKRKKQASPFILAIVEKNKDLFTPNPPNFDESTREVVCTVLGRSLPNTADIMTRVDEYQKTNPHYSLPMEPAGVYGHRSGVDQPGDAHLGIGPKLTPGPFGYQQRGTDEMVQWRPSDNSALPAGFMRVQKEGSISAWGRQPSVISQEQSTMARSQHCPDPPAKSSPINVETSTRALGPNSRPFYYSQPISNNHGSPLLRGNKMGMKASSTAALQPTYSQATPSLTKLRATIDDRVAEDCSSAPRLRTMATLSQAPVMKGASSPDLTLPPAPLSPSKAPPRVNSATIRHLDNPSTQTKGVSLTESRTSSSIVIPPTTVTRGTKRLGMGRVTGSYSNKKFKPMKPA